MGGSAEDWRPVQSRQPGLSLELDIEATSPAECAQSLADEIAKQMSGSFAICGYSMGGRISTLAAQALLAQKKKPEALILVSAGLGEPEATREARNQRDGEWAQLAASNPDEFWKKWYDQELFASFHSQPEAAREAWMEQRKSMEIAALTAQLRFLGPGQHGDLTPVLKELCGKGVRVLYIAGELDKKYSELSRKVKEIPGVLVDTIAGAGHILPLEAPEALALRIARFIR